LGYADSGCFDAGNMPENMRYWLDEYAREIAWAVENGVTPRIAIKSTDNRTPIEPMCTTRWNQSAPFNNMCPIDPATKMRSVTGCAATAMAQLLKYHNWPVKGSGSYSYMLNDQEIAFDYGNTTFDWENMIDVYTSSATDVQKDAVATLMRACGNCIDMKYSSSSSGAVVKPVPEALSKYFGYAPTALYTFRQYFSLGQWEDFIYNQLVTNGPMMYMGQTGPTGSAGVGAHAFICDGYSSDSYYHINWGWGGASDGYFRLTALDPPSQGIGGSNKGYNYVQYVVTNVQKPADAKPYYLMRSPDFNVETSSVSLNSLATFTGGFYNIGDTIQNAIVGVKATPVAATGQEYFMEGASHKLEPNVGYSKINVTIPSSLPEGTYRVSPAFTYDGYNNVTDMVTGSGAEYVTMTIANGTATFTSPSAASPEATSFAVTSPMVFTGVSFDIDMTLTNTGETEFYDSVICYLGKLDGSSFNVTAETGSWLLDIPSGVSINKTATCVIPSTVAAGEYYLILAYNGKSISEAIPVTVNPAPTSLRLIATGTKFTNGVDAVDPSDIEATTTLICTAGVYYNTLRMFFFAPGESTSSTSITSEPVYVTTKGQATVKFKGAIAGVIPQVTYRAIIYYTDLTGKLAQLSTTNIKFIETSGIETIHADDSQSTVPAEYFDLTGRRLNSEPEHGLYIKRQGDKSYKIKK
ncbi:MAG: C10 family peptidase, partial [Muribaculaceae bacterium]|nr:C10 family peptidase [Muribaculaceae bacterium]